MIRRNFTAPAATTFGAMANLMTPAAERPEAEIWLNIGYLTGDPDYPLVTMPYGIPVDTQKPLKVTGRDAKFLAFTGARNNLLEQIQQMAGELKPGEESIIGGSEDGLVLQLRRRSNAAEAPPEDSNPFVRPLFMRAASEDAAAA